MNLDVTLGAAYLGEGRGRFRPWAPLAQKGEGHIRSPGDRLV